MYKKHTDVYEKIMIKRVPTHLSQSQIREATACRQLEVSPRSLYIAWIV